MKIIVVSMFPALVFAGENGGVKEANGEAQVNYSQSRYADGYGLGGNYRLPVSDYLGVSLGASGNKTNTELRGTSDEIDSLDGFLNGSLFLRNFDIGKLGVNYSFANLHSEIDGNQSYYINPSMSAKAHTASVTGSYYIDRFTVFAGRLVSHVESQGTGNDHSWTIGATGYLPFDASVSISAGGMDARDNYNIGVEYQPAFIGKAASVRLSYGDAVHDDVFHLTFNYFFGNNVALIDRDRMYR